MKATTGADQERLEPSQTPYHRCQVLRLQLSYWLYPPSTDEYPIPFLTCEASFSPSPNKRVDPSERLWLGKEALTEEWMHWLQIVSGVFVILLGTWMLWRRLSFIARIKRLQMESQQHVHHHGAPDPFVFNSNLAQGVLEIINTPHGERFRMSVERASFILKATVKIMPDDGRVEELVLVPGASAPNSFESDVSPEEPHEFSAVLLLEAGETKEALSFKMLEPAAGRW